MSEQEQTPTPWERKMLENVLADLVKEQRARRRWGIFFKLIGVLYVSIFVLTLIGGAIASSGGSRSTGPHTALVQFNGVIAAGEQASAAQLISGLQAAFSDTNTKGVILQINSPGGSPVQAGMVYDEIRRQRKLHPGIKLHVVVQDLCASGGYYVAAAADNIYVDKASLVGSIGVLMDGFGFTGTMEKLGVERRLITAGENKGFLDPFSPMNQKQSDFAHKMVEEIHQQFIAVVKEGRGKRLHETPEMFSGLVWSGAESVKLGLADGFGTTESIARDVVKAEDIVDFTPEDGFAERLAKRFGTQFGGSFRSAAEGVRFH